MGEPSDNRPSFLDRWAVRIDLALVAVGMVLCAIRAHPYGGDGVRRFLALEALLERGEITGAKYSLVGPLFSAPLWLAGNVVATPRAVCAYYNWLLLALGLAVLYWLLRDVLERQTLTRLLLLLVFASALPQTQLHWGGEMFTAVFLATGFAALVTGREKLGAVLVILGTINTPATVVATAAVALVLAATHKRWRILIVPAIAVVLILAEAWLRRGHPLESGYATDHGHQTILPYSGLPGFSYPFLLGLVSILFSFGKGLLVFVPGLWLVPRLMRAEPKLRSLTITLLVAVASLVVVYAKWWSWYGGAGWGPRFFVLAGFLGCLALAVSIRDRDRPWLNLTTLALLAWSFWVGVNGLVFETHGLGQCYRDRYALELLCWYVPEFSPLARPFIAAKPLSATELTTLAVWVVAFLWAAVPLADALFAPAKRVATGILSRARELRTWRF